MAELAKLAYLALKEKGMSEEKECSSCGITGIELTEYPHRGNQFRTDVTEESKTILLCKLCASTAAGTATQYPAQYRESYAVLQTICYVGNLILLAIKEKKS